jgi:hypothetical protein
MKADHGKNTSQQRRRCLHIREKKGIGTKNGNETPPAPEKNRGEPGKKACKSGQEEDNHENGKKQFIYAMNIKSNRKSRLKRLSVARRKNHQFYPELSVRWSSGKEMRAKSSR